MVTCQPRNNNLAPRSGGPVLCKLGIFGGSGRGHESGCYHGDHPVIRGPNGHQRTQQVVVSSPSHRSTPAQPCKHYHHHQHRIPTIWLLSTFLWSWGKGHSKEQANRKSLKASKRSILFVITLCSGVLQAFALNISSDKDIKKSLPSWQGSPILRCIVSVYMRLG